MQVSVNDFNMINVRKRVNVNDFNAFLSETDCLTAPENQGYVSTTLLFPYSNL